MDEKLDQPIVINEDNQSCLNLVKVESASGRVKHIDTKQHFIRELCDKDQIRLQYCPTTEMMADVLTKPLSASKLKVFVDGIKLTD